MTYLAQANLGADWQYQQRAQACLTNQAAIFHNDARPDFVALSSALLRGESDPTSSFVRMLAASPGFAEAYQPDPEQPGDQSKIPDDDLLAAAQAQWPTVAGLFYDSEGAPLP